MKVSFSTEEYEKTVGAKPEGHGSWKFCVRMADGTLLNEYAAPAQTYKNAKSWMKAWAGRVYGDLPEVHLTLLS